MKLTQSELDYLSAWAREESEPDCYHLPAHKSQVVHGVKSAWLIAFIKAWTESEGKLDREIQQAGANSQPAWPWASAAEFRTRLDATGRAWIAQAVPAAS